jgi:phage-related protein
MTTFKFGGTSLTDFGVVTLINDYLDLPQRRGDNQIIPFRHGSVFVPKFYNERKMTFGIAIGEASATDLESTFDDMRALFSPMSQQVLQMTLEDASVREALATVDEPMDVQRFGARVAKVVVTFTLTEPFFRSDTLIADNTTTIDSDPKAMTVTNTGTMQERDPVIILTGPLADFGMTNSENGLELNYAPVIDGGDTVTIETVNGEYLATHSVLGNVTGFVTHAGDSCLMAFEPGDNVLSITSSTATTGTVKVSFYPPFI